MSSTYPPPADALEPLNPEKEPGMKCPEKTPEVAFEAVAMLDEDPAPTKDHVMEIPQRESWSGKMDFIISCVGYCIGLGNVWRFSYLCFKNGGGAFLIPYIIMVIVGGVPMYFLELAIGQYHQSGCLGIWSKRPAFKGIGYASLVITMWCNCYYPIVMAWALWYLFHSFRAVLPWSSCDNEWNSAQCVASSLQGRLPCYNATDYGVGQTANISLILTDDPDVPGNNSLPICPYNSSDYATLNETTSSEVEFWTYHTIRQSGGIEETGDFHYQMALLLLLVWLLCYFCIWKGVKWSGKVVYVTALFPYVLILVLLVRGVTLPGAAEGIRFYLSPQVHRLADSQVWIDAASQVFFSTGVGYGVVVVLGSYNGFHQDIYKSAILVSLINALTSLTAGFAIFSALGFLAHRLGKTVADVVASGPGLAFIVYPSALSQLPVSPFWAVLFFLMLFFVGFDTQFCMMEGFFTSVIDEFPKQLRKRRELFIGLCCIASFLVGLTMVTQSGIYIFQLMEWYAGSRVALIFVVFSESLTYGWFIDRDGFYPQIEEMIGYRPNPIFKACWKFVTPAICLGIFLFSLVQYSPVTYQGASYPGWAEAVGWMFTLSSILWIPGVLLFTVLRTEGSFTQRLRTLSWR